MDTHEKLQKIINVRADLKKDLAILIKDAEKVSEGVYFGKNVINEPNVFFDATEGDIFIGEGTKIKAHAVLRGPLIIGKDSVVHSFAEVLSSRIGDTCRIGGQVEHSIFENYSNKQHYGFVGYSYIGSWVNIGGGTSIATLKNTYGEIKMAGVNTGLVTLGAIIGDCVKTGANSVIFPGLIIGMGAHLYGTVTEDIPAFTSHVSPGRMYEIPLEIILKGQKAMMGRRNVEFTDKDADKIKELFESTQKDRG